MTDEYVLKAEPNVKWYLEASFVKIIYFQILLIYSWHLIDIRNLVVTYLHLQVYLSYCSRVCFTEYSKNRLLQIALDKHLLNNKNLCHSYS